MAEITTNTQLSIVDELKNKLGDIKDKMKVGGVSGVIFEELSSSAKSLQDKLNNLLSKQGFFTQSEVNDAYSTLQDIKRKELELESNKAKKKTYRDK